MMLTLCSPTLICLPSFVFLHSFSCDHLSTSYFHPAVAPTVLLSPEEELIRTPKMQTLRRVTEQSLLRLLTVVTSSSSSSSGGGEERLDIRGQRWHSGNDSEECLVSHNR